MLLLCSPVFGESISGTVFVDAPALAVRADFVSAPRVVVKLYRDGGALAATSTSLIDGKYRFDDLQPGTYWVAVDSRSFGPQGWPEQTFGPAGALCAQNDGNTRTNFFEGACAGGRSVKSDDASSLNTAEHVARVTAPASNVDFAFSYNIVTSIEDAGQGSLRQFVENANAIGGPNAMRFVPLTRSVAPAENTNLGMPPRWWTIALKSPLPALRDAGTTIDGEAHSILSTASVVDVNPGRIDEDPYIRKNERQDVPREEKPELEIVATGDEGITCEAACTVRGLAIHGAPNSIVTRADATIEQIVIGAHADVEDAPKHGNVGLQIERGRATLRFVYVVIQDTAGIAVAASGARVDADYVQVLRCGTPTSGAGVALLSDGSTFRHSKLSANEGAGIVIGSPDGKQPASVTVLEDSVISNNLAGIVFGPGSSRNTIARNQITWNRIGGVVASPYTGNPPQENRITSNIFDENGGRPIALNAEEKRDMLAAANGTCGRVDTVANHGIGAPVITSVQRNDNLVTITGRACPGQTVEVYRSYVTSEIRNAKENSRLIRRTAKGETITIEQQQLDSYPSIGEFNFMATAMTGADGSFEVTVPIDVVKRTGRAVTSDDVLVVNEQALYGSESDRAYSAIAIDPQGNTSEMSERTRVRIAAKR